VWFADREDEGIVYGSFFNPITNTTVALIATAVSAKLLHEYVLRFSELSGGEHT
jgi:Domain of unknown function (DUF6532)